MTKKIKTTKSKTKKKTLIENRKTENQKLKGVIVLAPFLSFISEKVRLSNITPSVFLCRGGCGF